MVKSLLDKLFSVFGLLFLSPIFAIVAILIKLRMPDGPVIFKQDRVGKNGKIFKDMKLMIDENSRENTLSNMMSQLSGYSTEDLIYIYNIIFPDKPLCAGTYTRDDMFTILTGSMCDEIEFRGGYGYDDLSDNIGTYEQQLSEWERMLDDDFRAELLEEADRAGV